MATLEDLKPNCQVKGILSSGPVTILSLQWHGSDVVEVTYRDISGNLGSELLFRDRQDDLALTDQGLFNVGRYRAVNLTSENHFWLWFLHRRLATTDDVADFIEASQLSLQQFTEQVYPLFFTVSRPGDKQRICMTYYGLGYHEHCERWITKEWFWFQSVGYPDVLEKKIPRREYRNCCSSDWKISLPIWGRIPRPTSALKQTGPSFWDR